MEFDHMQTTNNYVNDLAFNVNLAAKQLQTVATLARSVPRQNDIQHIIDNIYANAASRDTYLRLLDEQADAFFNLYGAVNDVQDVVSSIRESATSVCNPNIVDWYNRNKTGRHMLTTESA